MKANVQRFFDDINIISGMIALILTGVLFLTTVFSNAEKVILYLFLLIASALYLTYYKRGVYNEKVL